MALLPGSNGEFSDIFVECISGFWSLLESLADSQKSESQPWFSDMFSSRRRAKEEAKDFVEKFVGVVVVSYIVI